MAGREGPLLTVADNLDPLGVDAGRDQIVLGCLGPSLAETQVVLSGPSLVTVTLDGEGGIWICLQPLGVFIEALFRIRPDRRLVEVEEDILQDRLFFSSSRGSRCRSLWLWRRRRGNRFSRYPSSQFAPQRREGGSTPRRKVGHGDIPKVIELGYIVSVPIKTGLGRGVFFCRECLGPRRLRLGQLTLHPVDLRAIGCAGRTAGSEKSSQGADKCES